jgi:NDP-sugar pyrophosphorylase family protein
MPKVPEAIVLCGGAGLRLRDVTGSGPKSMATIAGRPFLELLLKQLQRSGFERAILAVGYQRDVIRAYFGERAHGLHLVYSDESSPLGTGGALRNAADLVQSDTVLIMNGDSYTDADLIQFVVDHDGSEADASMIVVPVDGRNDCGSVLLDQNDRLVRFEEKQGPSGAKYLNAGIYLVSRSLLFDIPAGLQISLERELLPRWLKEGKYVKGFVHSGMCVDIGTPERYQGAQDRLAKAEVQDSTLQSETYL